MTCAIESDKDHEAKSGDPIALLNAIREISHGYESHRYPTLENL
jgi:hypothetical protein